MTHVRCDLVRRVEVFPKRGAGLATLLLLDPVVWLVVMLLAALGLRTSLGQIDAEGLLLVAGPVVGWRSIRYGRTDQGL